MKSSHTTNAKTKKSGTSKRAKTAKAANSAADRIEYCVLATIAKFASGGPLTSNGIDRVRVLAKEVIRDMPRANAGQQANEVAKRFDSAPASTAAETPHIRRWRTIERDIFGTPNDHYRIGDEHSLGDMLKTAIAPEALTDDALSEGLDTAADDLHVFLSWITDADGAHADDAILRRTGGGIEARLRVLAELSRRIRRAIDASDKPVAS